MRLLLTEPAVRASGEALLAAHTGIELVALRPDGAVVLSDGTELDREDTGVEVAWATSDLYEEGGQLRAFFGLVRRLGTLRWFQSQAAGFDAPIFAELIRKGVLFTKSDAHSVPIAEFVLRAVLDHHQRPERWAAAQAARRWERHEFDEVSGSTWMVVAGAGPSARGSSGSGGAGPATNRSTSWSPRTAWWASSVRSMSSCSVRQPTPLRSTSSTRPSWLRCGRARSS